MSYIQHEHKGHVLFSDFSPERSRDFQVSDNSSECPDELYNLTKLAEVAAAAGQILESRHTSGTPSNISDEEQTYTYTHKLFDKTARTPRAHVIKVVAITKTKLLVLPNGLFQFSE